jgi:putative transposase
MPLGFSFVFGSPRTDGLAILFRDIARRNGSIPSMIHVDRGSENRSKWLQEFCCDTGIRYSPTAGSAWNSSAESMLKFVNTQIAQRLLGSTLPDRRGRSADGRYKSRRTARLEFSVIYKQIEEYLFTNLANHPQKGISPAESRIHLLSAQGNLAIPTVVDEPFLIRTSVPLDRKPSITDRRAIRLEEGAFTSRELSDMSLQGRSIEQARLDCEDAKVLYLKMGDCWLKAFHQRIQSYASVIEVSEQIFDLCMGPIDRASDRRIKRESSARLRRRVHEMNQVPTRTPPPPIAAVIGEKVKERRSTEQRPSGDIDPCDEVEE